MSFERDRAIVVMGRLPRAGQVKTRFMPTLSGEQAARLYEAFLLDMFALVDRAVGHTATRRFFSVALFEGERLDEARALVPSSEWTTVVQTGQTLGDRMEHARTSPSAEHVIVIGSDSPTMPPSRLVEALDALATDGVDAVFGPVADGGYDLVGLRRPSPELFDDVPWSTPDVMEITRQRARAYGLRIHEMSMGRDIDDVSDLQWALDEASSPGSFALRTRTTIAEVLAAVSRGV